MRSGFITLTLTVKCKVWTGNMQILHLKESFASFHLLAKLWPLYSEIPEELFWLTIWNMATL